MFKKLKIFQNGVQLLEVQDENRENLLSETVYDQYVNYLTDEIPGSDTFIVLVLFIRGENVHEQEFNGIQSVELLSHQPLPRM